MEPSRSELEDAIQSLKNQLIDINILICMLEQSEKMSPDDFKAWFKVTMRKLIKEKNDAITLIDNIPF